MFKEKIKAAAKYLRFAAALGLCLCFIAASPTGTSDDDGCGGSSSEATGTIIVQNYANARLYVTIIGPSGDSFQLSNGYQVTRSCRTGSYTVNAAIDQPGSPFDGQSIYSRSFTLSENETETCAVYY